MKKFLFLTFALLAACSIKETPAGEGTVSISLDPNVDILDQTKGNVSQYGTVPEPADFMLTITNYSSQVAWIGKYTDFDPETKFNVGTYTAKVESGNPNEEGKNKPCFSATEQFDIVNLETTPVTLSPKLSNCIVKVAAGNYVKNYFTSWAFAITTGAGNVFDNVAESDSFFIDAFKFDLKGTFQTAAGKKVELKKTFSGLQAATCYSVVVDVDNVAGNSFTIKFNDQVETIKIEEDLN